MRPSRRRIAETVTRQLLAGEKPDVVMQRLAAYLYEHRLLKSQQLIIADIEQLLSERGDVIAEVTTVHELDSEMKKQIETYVMKLSDAKTVELREHIDPTVLGGIVVRTPDRELDASIATKLRRLRTS